MRLLKSNYTLKETAEILRVSTRAIGDYLKKGILIRGRSFRPSVSRMGIARALKLETLMQKFQLLRADEAASMLGVSANSVYRYYKQGLLHCIKLNQISIFLQKDVEELLWLRE